MEQRSSSSQLHRSRLPEGKGGIEQGCGSRSVYPHGKSREWGSPEGVSSPQAKLANMESSLRDKAKDFGTVRRSYESISRHNEVRVPSRSWDRSRSRSRSRTCTGMER